MNLKQLMYEMDTVKEEKAKLELSMVEYSKPYFVFSKFAKDSVKKLNSPSPLFHSFSKIDDWLTILPKGERKTVLEKAMNQSRNIKNYSDILKNQIQFKNNEIIGDLIEIYRKFTLSIACLVLFFIGAPLGSIIRQGGLGWPLAYSIVFFIVYHVTSIIGEKSAEKMALSAFSGMWLSTFILLPLGIFLTYKAANDSALFSKDKYVKFLNSIIVPRKWRKL